MTPKQEKQIREKLATQRADIEEELRNHGGVQPAGSSDDLRDMEEKATALSDVWVDDRIAGDDENLLSKIDLALERLDEGTYEVCAKCGGPIPIERLIVKPSASLCVTCQEEKDASRQRESS